MKNLHFKIVKRAPLEAIVSLYREAGWWKEKPRARAVIPGMIKGSFCFLIAVTEKREIVGMGRVISDGVSDGYIQDVVVRRDYRGRGIGREIVARLTRVCRNRRLEWIGLVAAPGKSEFYRGIGFRELTGHVAMRHR